VWNRVTGATLVAGLAFGLLTVPALAAEEIGQAGPGGAAMIGCAGNEAYNQGAIAGTPSYSPSASGVITSVSARANAQEDQTIQLLVLGHDPAGDERQFITTQQDVVRTLATPNTVNTFSGLHIPIDPSQRIGAYLPFGSTLDCEYDTVAGDDVWFSFGGFPAVGESENYGGTNSGRRLNLAASVEPDADGDGFGDETQDQCPTNAGTQGACPSAQQPQQKRCKKGFHRKKVKTKSGKTKKKCVRKKKRK
jgi:hypothetical protein